MEPGKAETSSCIIIDTENETVTEKGRLSYKAQCGRNGSQAVTGNKVIMGGYTNIVRNYK